jgi:hypothetical protein
VFGHGHSHGCKKFRQKRGLKSRPSRPPVRVLRKSSEFLYATVRPFARQPVTHMARGRDHQRSYLITSEFTMTI